MKQASINSKANNLYEQIVKFLGSGVFFWLIVGFFVLQSFWLAFSFRFPMVYDEMVHFHLIQTYGHQLSPWLAQPIPTIPFHISLFHYLLGFSYRLISALTTSQILQIIFLRIINIAIVAAGLVVFANLLKLLNIRRIYVNIALLVFVLLPITPLISATINYDNLLFLLTAIYMFFAVQIIQNKTIVWQQYAYLIIFGCLASLTKYTFLPLFAASVIYLIILLARRHKTRFLGLLQHSYRQADAVVRYLLLTVLIVAVGMFSAIFVKNAIVYGTPSPNCVQIMSRQRCLSKSYGVINRNERARATVTSRPADSLVQFTLSWTDNMRDMTMWSAANIYPSNVLVVKRPLPVMNLLIFFGTILGLGFLLYAWRSLYKSQSWYFLGAMTLALFAAVFVVNLSGYHKVHLYFANQPRYLLSMLPVLLVMIVVATAFALRRRSYIIKLAVFIAAMLLFTQGGGAITHIVQSQDNWYWQSPKVIKANHAAKKILTPLVRQNYSKYGL